ncbi:MAG: sigma-70 family RNA polymerase sigma factor [Saprospiraceae bacterium]|nr:sigma-70 family RNA polymerase sigma factor [Saprospiraceae bacterium]
MNSFRRTVSNHEIEDEWHAIQSAQANPSAFRPLYDRYYEPIFQFIHNRTQDENLSADICSQVFLKAMQRLGDYTFRGVPFSAWLYRIASNEVAQWYRQHKKLRVVSVEETNLASMFEEVLDDDLEKFRPYLVPALDVLKAADLEIVEMRFFEQRPFKEIAEVLNITESNAKVRTYRVLERLKKIIESQIGGAK